MKLLRAIVESPYEPNDTNVLWIDTSIDGVPVLRKYANGFWAYVSSSSTTFIVNVDILPEASKQTLGKMYATPSQNPHEGDTTDEWLTVISYDSDGNPTYSWEQIGQNPDLSQFITKSVNNLENYYLKTQTFTQEEIIQRINESKNLVYLVVDELPQASSETLNSIYLVEDSQQENVYNMYITQYENSTYSWVNIGNTSIALSQYAIKDVDAVEGNIAAFDANGNPVDGGISVEYISQLGQEVGDIPELDKQIVPFNWKSGGFATNGDRGSYGADARRIIATIDLSDYVGKSLSCATESGYDISVRFVNKPMFNPPAAISVTISTDVLYNSGWKTSLTQEIPSGAKSAILVMRKHDDSNVDTSIAQYCNFTIEGAVTVAESLAKQSDTLEEMNDGGLLSFKNLNWAIGTFASGGVYAWDERRLICSIDLAGMEGSQFTASPNSGCDVSIRFVNVQAFDNVRDISGIDNSKIIYASGWVNELNYVIPASVKSAIVVMRFSSNASIYITDANKVAISATLTQLKSRVEMLEYKTNEKGDNLLVGSYYGEKVAISKRYGFSMNLWKTIPISTYAQSIAIYGDYIVFFYGIGTASGSLWQLSTLTKIADISFPYTGTAPHGNVMGFGKEFASGNTALPLLYVSEWDGDGGCLVYNLQSDGTITLVQTIKAPTMDSSIFGSTLGDFVVDREAGFIYSVKYHIASSSTVDGNLVHICRFKLPALSSGSEIVFTNNDILEYFQVPFMQTNQDKAISGDNMFIAAGNPTNKLQKIFVVNLGGMHISSVFDLMGYGDEPEGLEVFDGGIILGYGYQPQSFFVIKTE